MLIEILSIVEGCRASRTLARRVAPAAGAALCGSRRGALATVGGCLFHTVHRGQVSFEDVGAIEALFGR